MTLNLIAVCGSFSFMQQTKRQLMFGKCTGMGEKIQIRGRKM